MYVYIYIYYWIYLYVKNVCTYIYIYHWICICVYIYSIEYIIYMYVCMFYIYIYRYIHINVSCCRTLGHGGLTGLSHEVCVQDPEYGLRPSNTSLDWLEHVQNLQEPMVFPVVVPSNTRVSCNFSHQSVEREWSTISGYHPCGVDRFTDVKSQRFELDKKCADSDFLNGKTWSIASKKYT